MKCKYIPRKYARKEVGLEGRATAVIIGSTLIAMIPLYLANESVQKVKEYISGERQYGICPRLDEILDTLKLCWGCVKEGRFPEKLEQ
ncbi:MAG: hypothetical protein ABIH25_02515 [Candidatus Woesearchaeota archaeon]